ncbi:MAG: hypothetical protein ACKO3W_04360, partial [bacterium]
AFGKYAASMWSMLTPHAVADDISPTTPAMSSMVSGTMTVGPAAAPVPLKFALTARCLPESRGATLSDTSPLQAQLADSAMGGFLTTSFVEPDAYGALLAMDRPVAVITGVDIVDALRARGIATPHDAERWLGTHFGAF